MGIVDFSAHQKRVPGSFVLTLFLCIFCNYSEPHLDSAALHLDVASRHMK